MVTITLYVRQQKRHRCIEQCFGLCGRGRGIETCIISYKKRIASLGLMQDTGCLGHPSAPPPSILYHVLNLDWRFISYMILYMFQCHSPKSSHPLPQSPKVCSIHLCLFCCLTYRVIVTIFLNSIYMC